MSEATEFFLSRQPIVVGERRLVGWNLVFGAADGTPLVGREGKGDDYVAVLQAFAKSADWDALIGSARAYIHVDRRVIFSDVLDLMPRNRVVLGIPFCDEVDASLSNRLHALHSRRGTRLLFRDYARRDPREVLLDLADAVAVDAFGLDDETRSLLVRRAKRRTLQVMANAVARESDFVRIRDAGFDLIQGLNYQEPSEDEATRANVDGRVLLELLVETRGEFDLGGVTRAIESNTVLSEGLLRLVNSLELARAQQIENVDQALIMIGAQGLMRWLSLLLFQIGNPTAMKGPLFRVAASRARLLELITSARGGEDAESKLRVESAFLVGILSLVHVLLGVGRPEAIEGLHLTEEMALALNDYGGETGRLLRLSECLDRGEFVEVAEIACEVGLSPEEVWEYQSSAYAWVTRMS